MNEDSVFDTLRCVELYIVVNNAGQFFRRKGYGGGGDTWVNDPTTARVYVGSPRGARAVIGFFANNYPKYPMPNLVRLTVGGIEIIDETERVKKVQEARKAREDKAEVVNSKRELREAQESLDRARKRYEEKLAADKE